MTPTISFRKSPLKTTQAIIIPVYDDKKLKGLGDVLDKSAQSLVKHAVLNDSFQAKCGETRILYVPQSDTKVDIVILLGLGAKDELTVLKAEEAGGKVYSCLKGAKVKTAACLTGAFVKSKTLDVHALAAHIANGVALASYFYDVYKEKDSKAIHLAKFDLISDTPANIETLYTPLSASAQGTFLARDLVNTPPNDLYPEAYAKLIKDELKPLGVDVEIIDDKKLLKMGAGAISAVGQGSDRLPRMVIMRWNGAGKGKSKAKSAPLALVGKGVTFDTGGISLKPGAGMDEMKMDMGGSAAVVGTMKALALGKVKANVIGAVGLAENMPSSRAYRPGDVITSLSGKTIEVLNTDAEGRLVLADVMTHVQNKYAPDRMIDLATLTGAMMVALAHEYCGTFVNDDALWSDLYAASETSGEKIWRMPLDKEFKDSMKGEFGDVQNMSKMGRWGGACTAAGFLEHFVNDGVKWAHMDIAGTAWVKKDKPTIPKYGTGFGVRLLVDMIRAGV